MSLEIGVGKWGTGSQTSSQESIETVSTVMWTSSHYLNLLAREYRKVKSAAMF